MLTVGPSHDHDHGLATSPGTRTVFVDVDPLAEKYLTGIGRYTARLALALAKVAGRGSVRFATHDQEVLAPPSLDWSQDQDLARWARKLWRGRRVPLREAGVPGDSLGLYCCLREPLRRFPFEVSVLHDFTPLVVPWTHSARNRAQFQRFFARDLLHSDAALADSQATKADAAWLCDFDPSRITVAHPGPSLCVERHLDGRDAERRPGVGLVVATLEPRKNAAFLLDWFLSTEVLPDGAELWWVGPVGWLTSRRALKPYRRSTARGRRVRFLGVVSDATLCHLYRTAGWTAYPSLYEGFGLPVLDALRHGAPVLASYHSSLRELDHPGVFFFDPYDPATVDTAWQALRNAGGPATVAPRRLLGARYDWDAVARAVLNLRHADGRASRAA
jgi:glycosyltransferase involved in cell wall biosynthesis